MIRINKMKILHIQKVKGIYGTEKNVCAASKVLAARGHAVDVLLFTEPGYPVDQYVSMLNDAGANVTEISMPRHISLRTYLQTQKFLKNHSYDIVHTHLVHGDWYGITAARSAGYRNIISTKHNDDPFRKTFFFRCVEKILARRCVKVVTISQWLKTFTVRMGIPEHKTAVVYNGIDPDIRPGKSRKDIRSDFGISDRDAVYLIAARLIRQKGHLYLLDAFARLVKEGLDVKLLIAGEGDMERVIRDKTDSLDIKDAVTFLGFRKDVYSLMAASDIFVHPSLWEGFGTVFLEAMRAGLPVIAADVSAVPEIVVSGETGFLTKPADSDLLYGRMKELYNDPELRREMGKRGKQRVKEKFTLEKMADGFEKVYREVLERGT